jgi:membrane protein DedA with SNARE-associated domain
VHIVDPALAERLLAIYGYAAIFAMVMLESAGIPLPAETILISASIYTGTTGALDIRFVIAAAAAGAILGDNIGFWVGRTFGQRLLSRWGHLIGLDERKLKLGQYLFMQHGGKIVFFGRFVALLRAFAAILAGVNRRSTVSFLHVERGGRHRLGERFRFRWLCSGRRRSAHCRSHWLGRLGAGTCGWRHSLALLQKP